MEIKKLQTSLLQIMPDKQVVNTVIGEVLNIGALDVDNVKTISNSLAHRAKAYVKKIKQGKPYQYVFGYVEFLNTKIKVNRRVLIPRPETELMCEQIVSYIKKQNKPLSVLDLCTGSGAIAIAVAKNTNVSVVASDVSTRAINMAKHNAKLNKVSVKFVKSDLFKKINGKFDIIISNPPYIPQPQIELLDDSVKNYEPHLALDGGFDGLYFYREIANYAPKFLNKGGKLMLEIGSEQGKSVCDLLSNNFTDIEITKDYAHNDRNVCASLKGKNNE